MPVIVAPDLAMEQAAFPSNSEILQLVTQPDSESRKVVPKARAYSRRRGR
jgi:hypothetical protein